MINCYANIASQIIICKLFLMYGLKKNIIIRQNKNIYVFLPEPVYVSLQDHATVTYSVELNEENKIEVTYNFELLKTLFLPSEYKALQDTKNTGFI